MTYKVTTDPDSRYLELSFFEPADLDEHRQGRKELLKQMAEKGFYDGLILLNDCELDKAFSKSDSFMFGQEWDEGLRGKAHIAVVLPHSTRSQSEAYFIINIAQKDGFVLQPFYNKEQALAWLSRPRR